MTLPGAGAFGEILGQWALAELIAQQPGQPSGVDASVLAKLPTDYRALAARLMAAPPEQRGPVFAAEVNGRPNMKAIAEAVLRVPPGAPAPARPQRFKLKLRQLSTVTALPVTYLPGNYILEGMLTILAGDPGLGKTRLALSLAAAVSRGHPWPEGAEGGTPGNILWCGQEDTLEHVVKPVLEAMGGDPTRLYAIDALEDTEQGKESTFTLTDEGRDALEAAMQEVKPRLLIIDPITGHMGKADSFKDAEVRAVLTPLAALAHKYSCSVVGLAHLNKAQQQAVAYRIGGSIAFRAVARAVFFVAPEKDPDGAPTGRTVLYHDKGNLAILRDPRAYSIIDRDGYGVVAWDRDPVAGQLTDALSAGKADTKSAKVEQAEQWLATFLKDGPQPATHVRDGRIAAGIGERALDKAKEGLRVKIDKEGFGKGASGWYWSLPTTDGAGA